MTDPTYEADPVPDLRRESPPGLPRWVKASAIVVGVLIVLFLVLRLTGIAGQHGPARHFSGGEPLASVSQGPSYPAAGAAG